MYCFLKYTKVPVLSISTLVFSFYHLSSQNPQLVYTPSHLLVQYTRMGGGRGNFQQPTLYTYVTWPLFAYLCLALSLSCWPKNSPGQLSNPPVTPPKILWGGVCCHLGCTYSGQPGHILSQPVLSSPHT